jgi:hypothetical protein
VTWGQLVAGRAQPVGSGLESSSGTVAGAHRSRFAVGLVVLLLMLGVSAVPAGATAPNFGLACQSMGSDATSGTLHNFTVQRIYDSRTFGGGQITAGSPRSIVAAGANGIPATATAILANVFVTNGTKTSALTVYPKGTAMPATPLYGYLQGSTFAQSAAIKVGTGGQINLATAVGAVDVIVDLYGYYDTTPGGLPCADIEPTQVFQGAVGAGSAITVPARTTPVPETATTVIVRVEVLASSANSFATVYPAGAPKPNASLVNFDGGSTLRASNTMAVRVGTNGDIAVSNAVGTATMRVVVLGYFDEGAPGPGPGGSFTVTPAFGNATVSATASPSSGTFSQFSWDWGDGTDATVGATAQHTYSGGGLFRVRLTATSGTVDHQSDFFIAVVGPPGPPTGVTAVPGKEQATVSWQSPASNGGLPITQYTVTSAPDGATCTAANGLMGCVVVGLTAGVPQTFTVTATTSAGAGPPSTPSAPVTPWDGAGFHPINPARILDSRTVNGGWNTKLNAGVPLDLQITQRGGPSNVPASATAVTLNVTATDATTGSFLALYPTGTAPPQSSNLNFGTGQTIANLVTVKIGNAGLVRFLNAAGATHVIADVVGYYDDGNGPSDLFNGIAPRRLLDSRMATGGWSSTLTQGAGRDLVVSQPSNPDGVPPTATAVVANVTVTGGSNNSFLTVWPSGTAQPGVSNVNFAAGETIPNLVTVKIGLNGSIRFANAVGGVDVILDVVGYFDPGSGSRFHPINPTRILDDRVPTGLSGPWGPDQTRSLPVAGAPGTKVPSDATALVANVTATAGSAGSLVSVFPDGVALPSSSNLNFGPGQTIPNAVTVKIGATGKVAFYNKLGTVDLIADALGYYAPT